MEKEKQLLTDYIEEFKSLPEEERVAAIAKNNFLDGHLAEDPEIAAAFKRHPEKRLELYKLAKGLKPQVREYCWYRLDDVYQQFLKRFEQGPHNKRGSITFDFRKGRLETYLLPEKDAALLATMPEEQEEPFYVLVTLIQMDAATQRPNATEKPTNQRVAFLRKLFKGKH
jgi:hypothetical protein